jgi:hypothetical protein
LTPSVNGRVLHFEFAGLYDGVSILRDLQTRSIWHHVTGLCLYGPLRGRSVGPIGNLQHTTAREALAADPEVRVALSDRPIRQPNRWAPLAGRIPVLGPVFMRTMGREDGRRPGMDVGLGVWIDSVARYYPLETISAAGNALSDTLAGRRLAIFFSPGAGAPGAIFSSSREVRWAGDTLRLDAGEIILAGVLRDARGARRRVERPLQLFTRWYGFALMFPATTVYGPSRR